MSFVQEPKFGKRGRRREGIEGKITRLDTPVMQARYNIKCSSSFILRFGYRGKLRVKFRGHSLSDNARNVMCPLNSIRFASHSKFKF